MAASHHHQHSRITITDAAMLMKGKRQTNPSVPAMNLMMK